MLSYLNKENPNTWAVSICSVDGQRLAFGDNKHQFTLQSLIAPFLYSIAIDTYGAEYINSKVGHEIAPGGATKNIILDDSSKLGVEKKASFCSGKPRNEKVTVDFFRSLIQAT